MDAFYASVEQRDNPSYKGKPVIVGNSPEERGVVCAASYEARKFGVHSAMPSATAKRLCPQGIFVRPRFPAYEEASGGIHAVFREYTEAIEPLSLDEAFLDVTENKKNIPFASKIASEIRALIYERIKLTASAGVSYNKFLAKTASDINKPNGQFVIRPEEAAEFLKKLPVAGFYGVGKATEKILHANNIRTGADILPLSKAELERILGRFGGTLYEMSRGIDDRPVVTHWERKQFGREITFPSDIESLDELTSALMSIASDITGYLKESSKQAKTITLKVKYADFTQITRAASLKQRTDEFTAIFKTAKTLLEEKTKAGRVKIRLLGIAASNFNDTEKGETKTPPQQLNLEL